VSRRSNSLIKKDALMFRKYFQEMLRKYGIDCSYFSVKEGTAKYNVNGEFSAEYNKPVGTQVLFDQVPKISTLKKLGWSTPTDESQPILHIDYDLPGLQVGCLFSIEDPLRPGKGRLFRITKMSLGIIYPMCVTAQVVAVVGDLLENTLQPETAISRNESLGRNIIRPEGWD
jgi:hypothetical protein